MPLDQLISIEGTGYSVFYLFIYLFTFAYESHQFAEDALTIARNSEPEIVGVTP